MFCLFILGFFFATAFPVSLLFGHFMHDNIRVNEGLNGFFKDQK